uniref:Cytoplasmic dynein 2 heavy chain 1 n=2 Tax=Clastoptera arizonana TaxID=38151 RepID=A0A1B6E6Z8_9HEMI
MGIQDTSWNSMKTFLSKRGVKEDIRCFEVRNITRENRESVETLLIEKKDSFLAKTAKRASVAAAPLAAWVTANVKYSQVLEKIKPLEREQANLLRNLKTAENKIGELSTGLKTVDKTVEDLKKRLNLFTKEAAEIEIHLNKAQETIHAAESLVFKLDEEYSRWKHQLNELSKELKILPQNSILASAFVTYLSSCSQDIRRSMVIEWTKLIGLEEFTLMNFLGSERQQLTWQTQGLPSEKLLMENALIIETLSGMDSENSFCPLLMDPSSCATEWMKNYLSGHNVEVTSQTSSKFNTSLDLAIRFGKVLVVQDVDYIDPVLFTILRGDTNQLDVKSSFRLFLTTRNIQADIESHISAVISKINFTTTEAGLAQQLVQCALKLEKPELEIRQQDLLRREEELKLSLDQLQQNVLQQLASSEGDILQNKELLRSLNETKQSSSDISESLAESSKLKANLITECGMYQPLAEYASKLYFSVGNLSKINNMYQISIPTILKLFQKTLSSCSNVDVITKKQKFLQAVYLYFARSVYKSDRLILALHLVHNSFSNLFKEKEWDLLIGHVITEDKANINQIKKDIPSWISYDRSYDVYLLQNTLPELYNQLYLEKEDIWQQFPQKPVPMNLTSFQHVLLVQALCPDLLHSALTDFALQNLGLLVLSPPPLKLSQLLSESSVSEPILIITSPGSDPSEELRNLAKNLKVKYNEVSLGEGQELFALQLFVEAGTQGNWLCLKNLHLMISWLPTLEKELQNLEAHPSFKLWLTTEPNDKFPSMLASCCLRVVYEAPQGVKRNLRQTYNSWEMYKEINKSLFILAWFHAIVQERRIYIPQGWTKAYEFNDSDLAAAVQVLLTRLNKDGKNIRWDFIQGLCESAIYGARVENSYDLKVISSYLRLYFTDSVLSGKQFLTHSVVIPSTNDFKEHIKTIERLPEIDLPEFFGLSPNIDKIWQRNRSKEIIHYLKDLSYTDHKYTKFDRSEWHVQLSPLLNLWKKLNQTTGYIKMKVPVVNEILPPISIFFSREFSFGVFLIQAIHNDLANISRVIKGSLLPDKDIIEFATLLMQLKTPDKWLKLWQGSTNPSLYIQSVMSKVEAMDKYKDHINTTLNLSDVFHSDIFFSALKQQSSRDMKIPVNDLVLSCNWGDCHTTKSVFTLKGIQLEGAIFDGENIVLNHENVSDFITAPLLTISWVSKTSSIVTENILTLPLYSSAERNVFVTELNASCKNNEHDKLIMAGAAFYIQS